MSTYGFNTWKIDQNFIWTVAMKIAILNFYGGGNKIMFLSKI